MSERGVTGPMRGKVLIPGVLLAVVLASALVAALAGAPVWAALVGSGLMLGYWGLEALAWRRGATMSFGAAMGVALGAMVLRMALVLGVLVLVGVLARPAFATAALSFLAGFTVYVGLRLFTYPPAEQPARQAGAR